MNERRPIADAELKKVTGGKEQVTLAQGEGLDGTSTGSGSTAGGGIGGADGDEDGNDGGTNQVSRG
jgi:hypothetical protein